MKSPYLHYYNVFKDYNNRLLLCRNNRLSKQKYLNMQIIIMLVKVYPWFRTIFKQKNLLMHPKFQSLLNLNDQSKEDFFLYLPGRLLIKS